MRAAWLGLIPALAVLFPIRVLPIDWNVQRIGGDSTIGCGFWGPSVVVSNNRAYVGRGLMLGEASQDSFGVRILDVTDPANPRSLGQCECAGLLLAVSGDHLYVATDSSLEVHDVRDPARAVLVGSYSDGRRRDLNIQFQGRATVSGIYLYWAEPIVGLHVLDVSKPASPRLVARLPIADRARDVAVSGNFAYVAKGGKWVGTNLVGSGLSVIDISNPADPRLVGSYDAGGSSRKVAVAAGYAYVLGGVGSEGLHIIDVREPESLKEVGRFEIGSGNLAVSGNTVYLAGLNLAVLNVTDPSDPKLVGLSARFDEYVPHVTQPVSLQNVGLLLGGELLLGLAVVGDYVYAIGVFSGLHILTLHPANPQSLGRVKGGGKAAVSGGYAYLLGAALQVIDIGDPASPSVVGSYTNLPRWPSDVAVAGNFAYIAADSAGLVIIDVSDPAQPRRVGGLGSIGQAGRVAVSGGFAFVASYGMGLAIIDISTPSNPRRVGSFNADQAKAVTVSGNFAYLAELWRGRLHVIDITNPATPRRIGGYQSLGYVEDITVSGHYAFLAEGARFDGSFGGGLVIVDIIDPSHPQEVGRYSSSLFINNVAVADAYAYVADDGGLHVIDISNPANPRRVGGNSILAADSSFVLVDGERLFSAGDRGEMVIFDLFRPFRLEPMAGNNPNQLRLNVGGPRGVTAQIQRSTNLTNWEDWQPVTLGAAPTEISDPDAATATRRFYRGIIR
jgi:hypothetical protein